MGLGFLDFQVQVMYLFRRSFQPVFFLNSSKKRDKFMIAGQTKRKTPKMSVSANGEMNLKDPLHTKEQIIADYRLAFCSRQASLLGRKEVMGGKAKFGIFGDGKEVAQIALAKVFESGDFRSGYYRDQTFMFAAEMSNIPEFFAQLYSNTEIKYDPASSGRSMNNHFATRSLNEDGSWKQLSQMPNSSADISPTGSQMPRLVGLAFASRLYRELKELKGMSQFSNNGNEVAFGTIGNASCAEGMFWEAINAIGVLKAPAVVSIWDDEYGISVPNEHQITKDLTSMLSGFCKGKSTDERGFRSFRVVGWNYTELIKTYQKAAALARLEHTPVIIHVVELTQPQGHSTSGSHERYKPKERLEWERKYDCLVQMREWMIENKISDAQTLDDFEKEDTKKVVEQRDQAWEDYQRPIRQERAHVIKMIEKIALESEKSEELHHIKSRLETLTIPARRDNLPAIRETLIAVKDENLSAKQTLIEWKNKNQQSNSMRFNSHLYSESKNAAVNIPEVKPGFSADSPTVIGFEILNKCFDHAFSRNPNLLAFGEDVGELGGVNQGFKGLQKKYGSLRISDTGIRECTIMGQAIGLALRGLRPIAEIQYLDYVLYAIQILSDDLATLQWRTCGGQKAPVIIRTRGHRLEGIWHSGSPMAALVHLLRGVYICVPRNMTQAAGFYNTMLQADDSAIIVEVLNGYRLKETLPDNVAEFTLPLGVPEVLREGNDVTLVTYGAVCNIALQAAEQLSRVGVDVEIIDVQTLLPFDLPGKILESLKKTNRIVFADEDVPGGATAYMMQETLEKQGGYEWLDAAPKTISSQEHRPAFGSDGDYYSKPNVESVFGLIYRMMNESNPEKYPIFF